jgi:hypothetical protein
MKRQDQTFVHLKRNQAKLDKEIGELGGVASPTLILERQHLLA